MDLMKRSLNGEISKIKENRNGVKVRDINLPHTATENPLIQTFRYLIILLGIREHNIPSESQKLVLYNYVVSNMGKYTCEEIRTAFEMAVAGRMNVDPNSFQSLDSVFFSRIMNSYSEYIHKKGYNKTEQEEKPEPTEKEIKQIYIDFWNGFFEQYESSLKESRNKIKDPYGVIFDKLESMEFVKKVTDPQILENRFKMICKDASREERRLHKLYDRSINRMNHLYEQSREKISTTKRNELREEYKGLKKEIKTNPYFKGLVQKTKELKTIQFIDECLEFERDLKTEILEKL